MNAHAKNAHVSDLSKKGTHVMKNCIFKSLCTVVIVTVLCTGCAVRSTEGRVVQLTEERDKAAELIQKIEKANSDTPRIFSAKFVIEGVSPKNKKFKTLGEIACNREARLFKVTFVDSIFKSPMAVVAQDGRKIKVYMPVEKTIYEDDTLFINLKNYIDVNIKFDLISAVATWQVPMLKAYKIKQTALQKTSGAGKEEENYIVLENDQYFETISIKNDLPNKIMIINKITKEKSEFYFENPERENNVLYFNTIRYISAQRGERISVKFSSVSANPSRLKEKDFYLHVPRNTKTVRVH